MKLDRTAIALCLLGPILCLLEASASTAVAQEDPAPVVVAPSLAEFVEADYPAAQREAGEEANVEIELTVNIDGTVSDAAVVTSAGEAFDAAALAAVALFTFTPATRDGEAMPARIRYRYVFELRTEEPQVALPDETAEPRPGRLEGRVIGLEDGAAIAEAEVMVEPVNGGELRRMVTGADGTFRFDDLPAGSYQVTVLALEFGDYSGQEEVGENESTEVTYRIALYVDDENEFGATAVVDAPPREVVRRTITREELTRVPGTRGDALRVVELLPGVGRPAFGGGQLIVRGSSPQDSQVYLDSSSVPLLYHFGGLTSFMNSQLLERIDFYPGNFSARYGRKIGGILEVESREPRRDGLHGALDINIIDASIYLETPVGEDASIAVAARRSYIDAFFSEVVPDDLFDVVAAPVYYDYQVMAAWHPSAEDRFRLMVYGSGDSFAIINNDEDNPDALDLGISTEFHRFFLEWQRQLTDDIEQDLQVSVGPTLLQFNFGEDLAFDAQFNQIEARGEWRMRLSDTVRMIAGLDMTWTPFDLTFRGPQIGQQEGNGGGNPLDAQDFSEIALSETAYRPAVYTEFELDPLPFWRLVIGARLDWYREIESWSFDPRLVSVFSIDEDNRVKFGAGLFSQPPEFQESNEELGAAGLTPLHALHLGAGYERTLDEGITVGGELFYKQIWDRVVNNPVLGAEPRLVNEGIGRIYGLEISGRVQPQGRNWFGFLSYTFSRSERRDGPNEPWRLFDFDQTHILSVAGVYQLGRGWEAGATFRLVSGNPETPTVAGRLDINANAFLPVRGETNSVRGDLFHRLDVRVEKKWTFSDWNMSVYLDIQNVYNATNRESTIYNFNFTESQPLSGLPIIPSLGVRGEI